MDIGLIAADLECIDCEKQMMHIGQGMWLCESDGLIGIQIFTKSVSWFREINRELAWRL